MASILVVQHISASEEKQKYLCQLAAIAFLGFLQDASLCLTCCGDKRAAFHWHADRSCQQMQVLPQWKGQADPSAVSATQCRRA